VLARRLRGLFGRLLTYATGDSFNCGELDFPLLPQAASASG